MSTLTKKFALAGVGGITALALLPGAPVVAGDDSFQATGRPEPTNVFQSPEGPNRFTDQVRMTFKVKIDGARQKVIHLRHPGRIATVTFELEPGDSFPWHTHPGPVMVSVIGGGELSYMRGRDCEVRPYDTGTMFLEPGPEVHTAFNQGSETITLVGTFFDVARGEALSTPASPAKQARLDEKCGIGTVLP